MIYTASDSNITSGFSKTSANYLIMLLLGVIAVLGFAPFHIPGLTIVSMAFFYGSLQNKNSRQALISGFFYGIGYFGFGISWVIVSIHDYGQLNYFFAACITLIFISYLSIFPALVSFVYKKMSLPTKFLSSGLMFSTLWCIAEYLRSNLFTGFPWLLTGTPLIDTPLKFLFPVLGMYGMSVLIILVAIFLYLLSSTNNQNKFIGVIFFVMIFLIPMSIKNFYWNNKIAEQPISVAGIQANLSMRDKWDEKLFWNLLKFYDQSITKLLDKQLIILPESAIPLPPSYVDNYLKKLQSKAIIAHASLLIGILQPSNESEQFYYNSIISLGLAQGKKLKRQLVPFGEYIPKPLMTINHWLNLPEPNLIPGKNEALIEINHHPIASLICYEIAYPIILRDQLPKAEWIVSISDNGWFGHSFASYQQLQMSQILSLLTNRYQVVVNNDGLSSIIDFQGDIIKSLPAFSAGILQGNVYPIQGTTPWIYYGENPAYYFCLIFCVYYLGLLILDLKKNKSFSLDNS